jgi:glutamyl-tRNA reductase
MRALQEKFEAVRESEFKKALRRLPHLSISDRQRIEKLSRSIVKKILHTPMARLRNGAAAQDALLDSLRVIFDLDK